MRINKFVALATGLSRRAADQAIETGRVHLGSSVAVPGAQVTGSDIVLLDGKPLSLPEQTITLMLNKPIDYVVSRAGQGSKTIYDLLPPEFHNLKPIGRLDKNSSGLLLLSNDGQFAHQLTHPSHHKTKVYEVALDKPLAPLHHQMISDFGIQLDDGPSQLRLDRITADNTQWKVTMHEGRNRQIRRTFAALGYTITKLHRTQFGSYTLDKLAAGNYYRLGSKT